MKRFAAALTGALVLVLASAVPAVALQLPLNTNAPVRYVPDCTAQYARYGQFGGPVAQAAFSPGASNQHPNGCQGGPTVAGSSTNGGQCHYDGFVEQALVPSGGFIAFGMSVTVRGQTVSYSAFG